MAHNAFVRRAAARADRFASHVAFRAAAHVVAARHGVSVNQVIEGLSRAQEIVVAHAARGLVKAPDIQRLATARQEAIYLAVTTFGRTHKSIARVAGITPPAVRKALTKVEDRREDGHYDRDLDELELELKGA